jgi:serine/threonine-protein kinase
VVAVVSFTNISQDVADDWIGAGMAETITADLKRLRGVAVVGRERMYDALAHLRTGEARPLDDRLAVDVGRALGADWIVTGGYQRLGSRIRLTARLVNVGTQSLTRTVKLDGELADLFALQDRIVAELARWLEPEADVSDAWQPARDETASVEAYEAYARGMLNMRRATRESLERAMYLFEQAVARDPHYALAWAALGETYEIKASMLGLRSFADRAIECMQRAVDVDPGLADAHAELAWALLAAARHEEAMTAARTAVALEPSNARGHAALARAYWAGLGLIDEGIRELEIASSINPAAGYAFMQLGLLYALRGAYDRAEDACRRAIDLQEQYISGREGLLVVGARTRLGYVYYRRGRYDDALREYDRERAFLATTDHALRERTLIELNQKMGAAQLRLGNTDEARRRLDAAIAAYDERRAQGADEPFTTYYIAVAHALRGDADAAVRLLQQACTTLGALTRWRARHDPDFDAIRDTPGFVEALDAPPSPAVLPAALSPTQA